MITPWLPSVAKAELICVSSNVPMEPAVGVCSSWNEASGNRRRPSAAPGRSRRRSAPRDGFRPRCSRNRSRRQHCRRRPTSACPRRSAAFLHRRALLNSCAVREATPVEQSPEHSNGTTTNPEPPLSSVAVGKNASVRLPLAAAIAMRFVPRMAVLPGDRSGWPRVAGSDGPSSRPWRPVPADDEAVAAAEERGADAEEVPTGDDDERGRPRCGVDPTRPRLHPEITVRVKMRVGVLRPSAWLRRGPPASASRWTGPSRAPWFPSSGSRRRTCRTCRW